MAELVFNGMGLIDDDGDLGAMNKGGMFNKQTGLSRMQSKSRDVIWSVIHSKVSLSTGTNTRFAFFSGANSTIAAGNVDNGTLPQPQSIAIHELGVYSSGVSGAGLTVADLANLGEGVLEILVASKLMFQSPLWVLGVNGNNPVTTSGGGGITSGPARKLILRYPIMVPANTKFEAYVTTSAVALSGSAVVTLAMTGELSRLVV